MLSEVNFVDLGLNVQSLLRLAAAEKRPGVAAKWTVARRCMQRLLVRSGALMTDRDGEKACILEGLGDESAAVCGVSPQLRMVCMAYMAETIIRRLSFGESELAELLANDEDYAGHADEDVVAFASYSAAGWPATTRHQAGCCHAEMRKISCHRYRL